MATPTRDLLSRMYSRKTPSSSTTTAVRSFLPKEVFLHDWWLIKADNNPQEKRLGIGGFSSRERQPIRVFHSAPISQRLDAVTLKTEDGITITIQGHLNRTRTIENGFSEEVCNHFVIGFPYYWEEFIDLSLDEEKMNYDFSKEISGSDGNRTSSPHTTKSSLPVGLDGLPVTVVRDLFMVGSGDCGGGSMRKNILDDIMQTYGDHATDEEAPSNFKNSEADQKQSDDNNVINEIPKTKKNKRNTVACELPAEGRVTRSRARLKQ